MHRIAAAALLWLIAAGPALAQTTWDPGYKSANISLSGGNLTASVAFANPGANSMVRSTTSYFGGKVYFEATVGSTNPFGNWWLGFSDATEPTSAELGQNYNAIACGPPFSGSYFFQATNIARCATGGSFTGAVLEIAADVGHNLVWTRLSTDPAGTWNNDATADPATGAGGAALRIGGGGQELYIAWSGAGSLGADAVTLNTGASAFTGTLPLGFSAWGAGGAGIPGAQTTWNPADAGVDFVLENANSTATIFTNTGSGGEVVRSTTSWKSGKVYFEVNDVASPGGGSNWIAGLADATQSLTAGLGSTTHAYACTSGGAAAYNSTVPGNCTPGPLTGTILQVAADIGGNLIWFRRSSDAIWNDNAMADPATGAGGLALHIGAGSTCPGLYIAFQGGNHGIGASNADVSIINTGGTLPMVGAAPAGFGTWQTGGAGACPPLPTAGAKLRPQVWIAQ